MKGYVEHHGVEVLGLSSGVLGERRGGVAKVSGAGAWRTGDKPEMAIPLEE